MHFAAFLVRHPVFTTRQFAHGCGIAIAAGSRTLTRLARETVAVRITRGVWAQPEHPRFSPYTAVPHLLAGEQGYVSFLSAMHRHGLISQIPGSIHVATTGHGRTLDTPVGRYDFLHIKPTMMQAGIAESGTEPPYWMATAEKALLDTLYTGTRRGRRFASLPTLDLDSIDFPTLQALLDQQVSALPIRRAINGRLTAFGLTSH